MLESQVEFAVTPTVGIINEALDPKGNWSTGSMRASGSGPYRLLLWFTVGWLLVRILSSILFSFMHYSHLQLEVRYDVTTGRFCQIL